MLCIRHPIDRLYSDFLHMRQLGRVIENNAAFHEWATTDWMSNSDWKLRSERMYAEQLGQGDLQRALAALEDFEVIVVQEYFPETMAKMERHGWTSTDPEKHFMSWTPRRAITGRQALVVHPTVLRHLEVRFAGDLQIYYRALELALESDRSAA